MYIPAMDIASRLDEAMEAAAGPDGKKPISQSALARASGVSQPTINRILKGGGENGPETTTLKKLALALNVSFEWLNEGIGEMSRKRTSEAPSRHEGWSELTRVDATEHHLLTLYREASEPTKAEMLSQLEELSEGGAELDALPDQQIDAEQKSYTRATPRKTHKTGPPKARASERRSGK